MSEVESLNDEIEAGTVTDEGTDLLKLPDQSLAQILSYCDFETIMGSRKTCKRLSELAFSEASLAEQIKLNYSDENSECLQASDQFFRNIEICYPKLNLTPSSTEIRIYIAALQSPEMLGRLMKFLEIKGSHIKELTLYSFRPQHVHALKVCENLETLRLDTPWIMPKLPPDSFDGIVLNLRKLKVLEVKWMGFTFIGALISSVRRLERFNHTNMLGETTTQEEVNQLEEFILQQPNLKILKIDAKLPRGLFPEHRLKDVKFQLEEFCAKTFILDKDSAKRFIKMQKSLKKVEIVDFYDVEKFENNEQKYVEIIHEIMKLPRLKTLGDLHQRQHDNINRNLGVAHALTAVRNPSIESLCYDEIFESPVDALNSFPNLKNISFVLDRHEDEVQDFQIDFPTEHLKIIGIANRLSITYKPNILPTDPQQVAEDLLEFIERHNDRTTDILIGDQSWLDNDFSLPTNFWRRFSLKQFSSCEIYMKTLQQLEWLFDGGKRFGLCKIYTERGMFTFRDGEIKFDRYQQGLEQGY